MIIVHSKYTKKWLWVRQWHSLQDSLDPHGGGLNSLASLNEVKERIGSHKSEILLSELLIVYMHTEVAWWYFF